MTFTYAGTLATDLDLIRFKIGDTVSGGGPKPNGGNFTDEEISGLLAIEGNANRTIAAIYETLWSIYAKRANSEIGSRKESLSDIAKQYKELAEAQREQFGTAASTITSSFVTRVDGNSQDIDFGEVDNPIDWTEWFE